VTGSYRRGKSDCGDVDIVIARPNIDNGNELFLIFDHILRKLIQQGFLVDHLSQPSWSDDMANKPKHFKYMGICKLPGLDTIHHHIDILVVPWIHLGAALLYFTGNDICNRSMRLLASNRGMRLSDKGLFEGVIRGKSRKRVNEGHWVAGRTEREIFQYLKIDYLEPYEREC
jgi:DNA polymerase/3'-5' exonuclease PolX